MLAAKWQAKIMTLIFMKFMRDTHLNSTISRCVSVCGCVCETLISRPPSWEASCAFFPSFLILIREKFFLSASQGVFIAPRTAARHPLMSAGCRKLNEQSSKPTGCHMSTTKWRSLLMGITPRHYYQCKRAQNFRPFHT